MIPTTYRTKIPRSLSYVTRAKIISIAWRDVPQFDFLKISFNFSDAFQGVRTIFQVTYRCEQARQFSSHSMEDHGWYGPLWRVYVGGCQREDAHEVREWLREVGLPQAREWLHKVAPLHGEYKSLSWSATFDEDARLFSVSRKE